MGFDRFEREETKRQHKDLVELRGEWYALDPVDGSHYKLPPNEWPKPPPAPGPKPTSPEPELEDPIVMELELARAKHIGTAWWAMWDRLRREAVERRHNHLVVIATLITGVLLGLALAIFMDWTS